MPEVLPRINVPLPPWLPRKGKLARLVSNQVSAKTHGAPGGGGTSSRYAKPWYAGGVRRKWQVIAGDGSGWLPSNGPVFQPGIQRSIQQKAPGEQAGRKGRYEEKQSLDGGVHRICLHQVPATLGPAPSLPWRLKHDRVAVIMQALAFTRLAFHRPGRRRRRSWRRGS